MLRTKTPHASGNGYPSEYDVAGSNPGIGEWSPWQDAFAQDPLAGKLPEVSLSQVSAGVAWGNLFVSVRLRRTSPFLVHGKFSNNLQAFKGLGGELFNELNYRRRSKVLGSRANEHEMSRI